MRKIFLFLLTLPPVLSINALGQLQSIQITGAAMPPKTVVISIDDLPYEKWQSGPGEPVSWTDAIAEYLAGVQRIDEKGKNMMGVPVIWFPVSCHFNTEPPPILPPPASVVCLGARDQDISLLERLGSHPGFVVGQHTHSHIPAGWLNNPANVWPSARNEFFVEDMCTAQQLFGKYQQIWHFFRAPGLDWPAWAAPVANANPCVDNLDGPIGVDVGASFIKDDGTVMGGDWDCPNQGLTPEVCGDLYLRDIRTVTQTHGAIVLLHNYVIPGAYAFRLIQWIMTHLDADIRVVDLRTNPVFRKKLSAPSSVIRRP